MHKISMARLSIHSYYEDSEPWTYKGLWEQKQKSPVLLFPNIPLQRWHSQT